MKSDLITGLPGTWVQGALSPIVGNYASGTFSQTLKDDLKAASTNGGPTGIIVKARGLYLWYCGFATPIDSANPRILYPTVNTSRQAAHTWTGQGNTSAWEIYLTPQTFNLGDRLGIDAVFYNASPGVITAMMGLIPLLIPVAK